LVEVAAAAGATPDPTQRNQPCEVGACVIPDGPRGIIVGTLATSIGDFVRGNPAFLGRFPAVLITVLDSESSVQSTATASEIMKTHSECFDLQDGLVVPGPLLSKVADDFRLFTGFDELWCFRKTPSPKPRLLSIVPPTVPSEGVLRTQFDEWMKRSDCVLGLGDGIGMNYVTTDSALASALENLAKGDE
jgi:hypothetical protein